MNAMFEQRKGEDFVRNNIEPQTNADRIRAYTDEELAEFLDKFDACKFIYGKCIHLFGDGIDCNQCIVQWLKSEAKE